MAGRPECRGVQKNSPPLFVALDVSDDRNLHVLVVGVHVRHVSARWTDGHTHDLHFRTLPRSLVRAFSRRPGRREACPGPCPAPLPA